MVIRSLLASNHTQVVTEIRSEYQQRKKLFPDGKMCNTNFENILDEGFGV